MHDVKFRMQNNNGEFFVIRGNGGSAKVANAGSLAP
jgi:hypothetical protein